MGKEGWNRRPSPQKGFSLLELLVVVIIVGILATVAMPNFTKMLEKAKMDEAKGVLQLIYQAERMYKLDQGGYGTIILPSQTGTPGTLVSLQYLANPNPNQNWDYTATAPTSTTFIAKATRTSGCNKDEFLQIAQSFDTGNPNFGTGFTLDCP